MQISYILRACTNIGVGDIGDSCKSQTFENRFWQKKNSQTFSIFSKPVLKDNKFPNFSKPILKEKKSQTFRNRVSKKKNSQTFQNRFWKKKNSQTFEKPVLKEKNSQTSKTGFERKNMLVMWADHFRPPGISYEFSLILLVLYAIFC